MRITMQSQQALIGIETTPGRQSIQTEQQVLDIQTEKPQLEMETTHAKVTIDQSQSFAESGLKSVFQLIRENAQMGYQQYMAAMARYSSQGDEMANIQNKNVDVVAEQADDNAFGQFSKEFGMVTMPRTRPQIDVIPGEVRINLRRGTVQNKTVQSRPQHDYERGKVDLYLRQRNSLQIDVVYDEEV